MLVTILLIGSVAASATAAYFMKKSKLDIDGTNEKTFEVFGFSFKLSISNMTARMVSLVAAVVLLSVAYSLNPVLGIWGALAGIAVYRVLFIYELDIVGAPRDMRHASNCITLVTLMCSTALTINAVAFVAVALILSIMDWMGMFSIYEEVI